MDLTTFSFKRSQFILFAVLATLFASISALQDFPSQEEPSIHIRIAATYAICPGMSVYQMENLVARPMEEHIRELAEVKKITTRVRPGFVLTTVEIQDRYNDLQPIWQRLRSKMREIEPDMPEGVQGPFVDDDYGRVTVASLAISAPGFDWNEIRDRSKWLRDRLYSIPGTERITIHGLDNEAIYLEISNAELARHNLTPSRLIAELGHQNIIIPSGEIESGNSILPVSTTGDILSINQLQRIPITLNNGKVAYLGDLVTVKRGLSDPQNKAAFFDGKPTVVLAVSMADGQNVLSFCNKLKTKVTSLERELPAGFKIDFVTFQADVVKQEIDRVKHVLFETLVVVLIVVVVFVGLRTGVIVGTIVPLTLLLALLVMRWCDIELDTVSLAALIISLGLLVDNGIVIAEDVLRRIGSGQSAAEAARMAGKTLAIPLLTSTLACVAAFLPLTLSKTVSGEYARALSTVLTITLLCSWCLCLTVTPLLCSRYAKVNPKHQHSDEETAYQTRFYKIFRRIVDGLLAHRVLYLFSMIFLLIIAGIASVWVPQSFLPNSGRMQIQIPLDLAPNASSTETISSVQRLAEWLNDRKINPEIINHITYVGEGGPRVVLAIDPPDPVPHSAYIIVNLRQGTDPAKVLERVRSHLDSNHPEMRAIPRRFSFGMHDAGTVIYRISGPDIATLRELSTQYQQAFRTVNGTRDIRDDWEANIGRFKVVVDQEKARKAGVSSADISTSLRLVYGAQPVSGFRDDDRTLPVLWRAPENERKAMNRLSTAMVFSQNGTQAVPLSQVARIDFIGEPSIIRRYNLERTVSVYARNPGLSSYELVKSVKPAVEKITTPPGYTVELGGEIEENEEANQALFEYLPLSIILLIGVFITQFNSLRKVVVIMICVPFCFIGVVLGMIVLHGEFNFMAMLGMLALAGIIVSNAVLLLDRIEIELGAGRSRHEAIVMASLKRLRPILMTKLTCIAGMVPMLLFGGPLWHGLAVAIIGGLSLGTLVTLGLVPVVYSLLFKDTSEKSHELLKATPAILAGILIINISGCAVGPDYHFQTFPTRTQFASVPGTLSTNYQTCWWTNFNDPTLERLISDAQIYNHDVRAATERLKSVRALHRLVKWGYAPSGAATAGYQRKLITPVEMPGASRDMRNFDLFDTGFDASWELDIWGQVRRQNQAVRAVVNAVTAQRDAVLISVTAEIARQYFELRNLQDRLAIVTQIVATEKECLRLTQLRYESGKGSQLEVQTQTAQMATTEALLPDLNTAIAQIEHALGLLAGHDHLELKPLLETTRSKQTPPPTVWLGKPADLLRRRPDIRMAEQQLIASTALIGAEMANYFPHVSFNGQVGLEAKTFSGLSQSQADTYGFGPRITWTAFDFGRIKARVDASKADTKAYLAIYEKTVLTALAETDNALISYGHAQSHRKSLETAYNAAYEAHQIAIKRQKEGLADKITVLESERHMLETQNTFLQAQTEENTDVVAIYKALGGGWEEK
mgnify:CR=1 FL=1